MTEDKQHLSEKDVSENVAKYWNLLGQEFSLDLRGTDKYYANFTDDGWIVLSGANNTLLNIACIYKSFNAEEDIDNYINLLKRNNIPGTLLFPEMLNIHIIETAKLKGFQDVGNMPLMECKADNLQPLKGRLDVVEIRRDTPEAIKYLANMQGLVFGFPSDVRMININPDNYVRAFIGRDKGKVVSTVTTIQSQEGKVGIWSMGTEPAERGQGYGGELLSSVMNTHIQNGAESFHLLSSHEGRLMYSNRGFKTILGGNTLILEFNPLLN